MEFEIRENRGPGGGRRPTREREAYLQLMQQGYGSREAGRIVGINRRSGKRWRNGWHSPTSGKPKPPTRSEASASSVSGRARYLREELHAVAAELNSRPRKTLGWETPAERLAKLLATAS